MVWGHGCDGSLWFAFGRGGFREAPGRPTECSGGPPGAPGAPGPGPKNLQYYMNNKYFPGLSRAFPGPFPLSRTPDLFPGPFPKFV